MPTISVRDASLFVEVAGHGYPLLLMHGGPGLDHTSLAPFRALEDQFTLIFYDHRCNGRSDGGDVTTMTWDNLTADAEALRRQLGYDRWAVLGHSFGGTVALEYALRYPGSLSHLILMDTGADAWWMQEHAPALLAARGFDQDTVETARRFYNGRITPDEMMPSARKLASAYYYHLNPLKLAHEILMGMRTKVRPEAFVFGYSQLYPHWNRMDQLPNVRVPTLVLAGRHDFLYPPEHQEAVAAAIPDAQLVLVDEAGHNPQSEKPEPTFDAVRDFLLHAGSKQTHAAVASATYDAIDAFVAREMGRLKIPGAALAIVDGDRIVHQRGFGAANPAGDPPTAHTPFFLGSVTKSFTALAVMQLVDAGRIDLHAPVRRYLPWFRVGEPHDAAAITIHHLLTQTSGLPALAGELPLADFDTSRGAAERHARSWASLELAHAPGTAFEYSNANYILLGLVIEAVTGESYATYVRDHIFLPLGMLQTYTTPDEAAQDGLATGYRFWFTHPIPAPGMALPRAGLAGGGIISTAADMARYAIAHLNGGHYQGEQLVAPAAIDTMHRGAVDVSFMGTQLGRYGMGWYDDSLGDTRLVWHSGILPHFYAFLALLPDQKKGLVLLLNADQHWMSGVLTEFGSHLAALLAGEQPVPVPLPILPFIPPMLRALPAIPALQLAGAAATLARLRRPQPPALTRDVLLPLIPNLLPALLLRPLLGKRRDYVRLYMPDIALISLLSGTLALLWTPLRTALLLNARRLTTQTKETTHD